MESLQNKINFVQKILSNKFLKTIITILTLSPIFFDIFTKVIQKLVFLRLIKTTIPKNLEAFYIILNEGIELNIAATSYEREESEKEQEPNFLQRMLSIDPKTYSPPQKFMDLKFTTLVIFSGLPLIIYPLTVYIMSLALLTVKKRFGTKYFNITKNRFEYHWKNPSRKYLWLMNIIDLAYDNVVWGIFIKSYVLILQNFSISIFLDIFNSKYTNIIESISHILSYILGLILIISGLGFYSVLYGVKSKPIKLSFLELKILGNIRRSSHWAVNFLFYKWIIRMILMSLVVVIFYEYPYLVESILILLNFTEVIFAIFIRPFDSIVDNIKLIFETVMFFVLYVLYIPLVAGILISYHEILGYVIIGMIIFLCMGSFALRIFGSKSL